MGESMETLFRYVVGGAAAGGNSETYALGPPRRWPGAWGRRTKEPPNSHPFFHFGVYRWDPVTLVYLATWLRGGAATATLPSLLPKAVATVHVGPGRTARGKTNSQCVGKRKDRTVENPVPKTGHQLKKVRATRN